MASITITTAVISTNQTISTYKANNTAQLNTNNAFVNTLQPNNLDYKTYIAVTENNFDKNVSKAVKKGGIEATRFGLGPAGEIDAILEEATGKGAIERGIDGVVDFTSKHGGLERNYEKSQVWVDSDTLEEAKNKAQALGVDDSAIKQYNGKYIIEIVGDSEKSGSDANYFRVKPNTGELNTTIKDFYDNKNTKATNTVQEISDNNDTDLKIMGDLKVVNSKTLGINDISRKTKITPELATQVNINSVAGTLCNQYYGSNCTNYGSGSEIRVDPINPAPKDPDKVYFNLNQPLTKHYKPTTKTTKPACNVEDNLECK